jgi:predicted CXXCH cytochrome family protein
MAAATYFFWSRFYSSQRPKADVVATPYADPKQCAACHQHIWKTFQRTGMARSFFQPSPENTVESYGKKFYHQASDSYFEMIRRDDRYYQRRYQIAFDSNQTNLIEKQVDYVMGSGNHVRTYLSRTSRGTIVELPLAWYAEKGGYWAMNPGYDRPDHQGFHRLITYDCMFCHNGYPEIPRANEDPGSEPVYSGRMPDGIDCQRCHGPGEKHVRAAGTPGAKPEEIRRAIVNPARLSADRQMEVCMQCHLDTTSFRLPNSIVRYDRGPFSYQPGNPLSDFMLHFDQAAGQGHDDKFEIASAAYRLRRSACFQKSNGALRCTICHNPHDIPRGEEAARHYSDVCRQCHADQLSRMAAAGKHPQSGDCIGCHMPRRRTDDVVHVVMTDHNIQRRPPARDLLEAMPEFLENDQNAYHGEVVLYYPRALPRAEDELYLAVAQVSQSSNLREGIPRLKAAIDKFHPVRAEYYLQLGDALRTAAQFERAIPVYEEALRRKPTSLRAMQKLAFCFRTTGRPSRAIEMMKRALEAAPSDAESWHQLGLAYLDAGQKADAIAALQKANALDPDLQEAANSLGGVWFESGELPKAEDAFRNAIRIQPDYAEARNNLGNLLSSTGRFEEARHQFETALRLKANYAAAHYNYAVAFARVKRFNDAQRQLESALRVDANLAEAHDFLGSLLAAQGRFDAAVGEYREAIRIRPDLGRANLDLGSTLADLGDVNGALPYLRKAAKSSDAAIREEAGKILKQLGTDR